MKQFVCVLDSLIDQYLKRQRAFGREYSSEEWMLRSLRISDPNRAERIEMV